MDIFLRKFLYYFRLITITLYVIISTLFLILISIFRPRSPKNATLGSLVYSIGSMEILGIQVDIRGRDNIPSDRPCVIICNHQDNLDFLVLTRLRLKNTLTIGKKSLLWIPIFGIFYWLSGNILIDRQNKKKAFMTMVRAIQLILRKNLSIWIFPEGTRNWGKGLRPFKRGAFYTAIRAQVPIIPICISTYKNCLDISKLNSGKVIIDILPPIQTDKLEAEADSNALTEKCYEQMSEHIKIIDAELRQELTSNH